MAMIAPPKTLAPETSSVDSRTTFARSFRGQVPFLLAARLGQAPDRILDDDHRPIDDQTKVDGAQAHEVTRGAGEGHEHHREQHREGDGHGDHEPRPQVPEQQEEDDHDQQGTFGQVLADRRDRPVHQVGAVVEGLDADAGRQGGAQLVELGLHALGDGARVLAEQHEGDADHHLALAVHRRGAAAQARAEADITDGRDGDRHALRRRADDDRLEIVEALDQAGSADDQLLAIALDVPAAGVLVRAFERANDVLDRQPDRLQALRIDHHLVLLVLAAEAVHLDDAGDGAELRTDVPVEGLLQLHQ